MGINSQTHEQRNTFLFLLRENVSEAFSWRALVYIFGLFIGYFANGGEGRFGISFLEILSVWQFWAFIFIALIADAIIRAIYWYFRLRNPSYIRKMEEIERLKQEKAAAKQKSQSGGGDPV